MPGVRYWAWHDTKPFMDDALAQFQLELANAERPGGTALPDESYLCLSGGAHNGAFGAGLLLGWTAHGTRPDFVLVTGISTGALIAPFAFLGERHDGTLREVFTEVEPQHIFRQRGKLAAIFDDAMADTAPLYELISRHITEEFLEEVAQEYSKGRWLIICTTNLDARQPVLWNMGKIALSQAPGRIELFRRILLASASVPGAFPPVLIDVEVDGEEGFQEMHVDGGAISQVFLWPPAFGKAIKELDIEEDRRGKTAYVVRNARLDVDWAATERRTLSIMGRAVSALLHNQGNGDLLQIFQTARRDGLDFNLAYIGSDFTLESKEPFDREYMNALFSYGYDLARNGYPWQKTPPGWDE